MLPPPGTRRLAAEGAHAAAAHGSLKRDFIFNEAARAELERAVAIGTPALSALSMLDNTSCRPTLHRLASTFSSARDASVAAADADAGGALTSADVLAMYTRHHPSLVSPLALAAAMVSPGPQPTPDPLTIPSADDDGQPRVLSGSDALREMVFPRFFPDNETAVSAAIAQLEAFRARTGAFQENTSGGTPGGGDQGDSFWRSQALELAAPELTKVARRLCGAFGGVAGADRRRRDASLLDVPADGGARMLEIRVDAYQRRAQDFAKGPNHLDLLRLAMERASAASKSPASSGETEKLDPLQWAEWDAWLREEAGLPAEPPTSVA